MKGSIRGILEVVPQPGLDPSIQADTDVDNEALVYTDLGRQVAQVLQIAPSDVDTAVAIPNTCACLLESDEPVLVRLAAGETQMRIRAFLVGSEDAQHSALTARNLLLSGNGSSTATVTLYALGQHS